MLGSGFTLQKVVVSINVISGSSIYKSEKVIICLMQFLGCHHNPHRPILIYIKTTQASTFFSCNSQRTYNFSKYTIRQVIPKHASVIIQRLNKDACNLPQPIFCNFMRGRCHLCCQRRKTRE